jgi:hypothetical protein
MDRAEFPQGNPQTIHKDCGNRIQANLALILVGIGNGDRGPMRGSENNGRMS